MPATIQLAIRKVHGPSLEADEDVAVLTLRGLAPDGTVITYLKRRFVPPQENFATLAEHQVVSGDRVDNLAARYLGDPEQYWRLCDANGAMNPAELTEVVGSVVRITLPEGVPGVGDAG